MAPVKIFLSYARVDDESFVKTLYNDLTTYGFDVWWDREKMESRGSTFLQEIRDAIAQADRFVLVVGPNAPNSPYVHQEWIYAFSWCIPITPVLRLGDYSLLPLELKNLHCVDYRSNRSEKEALEELIRILRSSSQIGSLMGVPELPPHFLPRNEVFKAVKGELLRHVQQPTLVTGTARKMGIYGMGGVGKSVLATALARDCEVRRVFPDGILWLTIGQKPTIANLQSWLIASLGGKLQLHDDVRLVRTALIDLLSMKACLLILDDVWQAKHIEAFDALGQRCQMVITTRNAEVVKAVGANEYQLNVLSDEQGQMLLAEWAHQTSDPLSKEAQEIVHKCGNLPLALAMIGAMVRGHPNSWESILYRLRKVELEKIHQEIPDYPYPNLLVAIQVSVDALPPSVSTRYLDLAVFPRASSIPQAALQTFWGLLGLDLDDTEEIIDILVDRSLIHRNEKEQIVLHDLLIDYITKQVSDHLALHNTLLDAYSLKCSGHWSDGPNDGYFFQNIIYHLGCASRLNELANLLCDLDFLMTKTSRGMVFDLARDFLTARMFLHTSHPQFQVIELLEEAILTDIHFLQRHPTSLFQCLWNRCWWYDCPEAVVNNHWLDTFKSNLNENLLLQISHIELFRIIESWRNATEHSSPGTFWLRSLRPPVKPLGTSQHAVFSNHSGSVRSVLFSSHGKRIISGGDDKNIYVCDATSGQVLSSLAHDRAVTSLVTSPDEKTVYSGSEDGRLRIWDIYTGKEQGRFDGHKGEIWSISLVSEGRFIASGSSDKTVRIWDLKNHSEVCCLRGHQDTVSSVAGALQDDIVLSGSLDQSIRVWNITSGEEKRCLYGHEDWVLSIALTPDYRKVISGSSDKTVRVWDIISGIELKCLHGHSGRVLSVAVSPDGKYIISGSSDKTVRVWDIISGNQLFCFQGHEGIVTSVSASWDIKQILSGSDDCTIRLWSPQHFDKQRVLKNHTGEVLSVEFSLDGKYLISAGCDKAIIVWNTENGSEHATLWHNYNCVTDAMFSPDNQWILFRSDDNVWRIWDENGTSPSRWQQYRLLRKYSKLIQKAKQKQAYAVRTDGTEMWIESNISGERVAWFPISPSCIATHPSGHIWAAAAGNHVYILALEQQVDS